MVFGLSAAGAFRWGRFKGEMMEPYLFEDELPLDISDDEYAEWHEKSWIDITRVGPRMHFTTMNCWCGPYLEYEDPDNGNRVIVHREIH